MIRKSSHTWLAIFLACASATAQTSTSSFPTDIVIARHTFFDIGPPFDFYELFRVGSTGTIVSAERALITPAGYACFVPPKLEIEAVTLQTTLASLLENVNPCGVPEKVLRKERKRCKKCLTFSGADITMHVHCGSSERQLRMDILEKDWFERTPGTPSQTSWAMRVMSQLDAAFGPGVMDKPVFLSDNAPFTAKSSFAEEIRSGKYDSFADSSPALSEMARKAADVPHPPSVSLVSVTPTKPITAVLPSYPPIAKAAQVHGQVSVSFQISPQGAAEKISVLNGPEMLRSAVYGAIEKWQFPTDAFGKRAEAVISFDLNCVDPQ